MASPMVSLLIPTINRSDFLIRQLNYYRDVGFQGYICVGDSSNTEHLVPTKKALESFKGSLNIIYREYPGLNDAEVLKRLLELVVTPYAAFVADDDFLIPSALEQCALFLDSHSDYNSAHGAAVSFSLKSSGPYGQVIRTDQYDLPVIDAESASQRILAHLNNYAVTLFCLHRIESWRDMYKDISLLADKTFASEMLPCCQSVIQGKAKELDCLYLVRQDHSQRYFLPDKKKWVRNPKWPSMYQVFVDLLARALAKKDDIGMFQAEAIIKQAFDSYMVNLLGKRWQDYCGRGNRDIQNRMRLIARTVPGVLPVWRALHWIKSDRREKNQLLAKLLNPSSPYHADFLPIYRTVTGVDVKDAVR